MENSPSFFIDKKKKVSIINDKTWTNTEVDAITQSIPASKSGVGRRRATQAVNELNNVIGANMTSKEFNIFEKILIFLSYSLIVIFFPLSLFFTLKTTQEYE